MVDTSTLYILVGGILVLILLFSGRRGRTSSGATSHTSGSGSSNSYPVIGNLIDFLRNRYRFLEWATELISATPSGTLRVHGFAGTCGVCTANPHVVERILKTNFSNYVKGQRFRSVLTELVGDGIFNADGELWARQRKIASYEFSTKSMKSFVVEIVQREITERLMPTLLDASKDKSTIDLQGIFQKFGFDNICNLAFGYDPACLESGRSLPEFAWAFDRATKICTDRFFAPIPLVWKMEKFLNIRSERKLREAIQIVDDYAMKIILSRKEELARNNGILSKRDLLSRFMSPPLNKDDDDDDDDGTGSHQGDHQPHNSVSTEEDDKEKQNGDKFLRDIITSFILAGKDSTSAALTWFFWLISVNQEAESKIYNEVFQTVLRRSRESDKNGSEWAVFQFEELKEMHYLHAAISEALRLFPPVPINSRLTIKDEILPDGTFVSAGWFADYSAYAMARSKDLWGEDCNEFLPERWLQDGKFVPENQFKFPVFHAGPRACLGKDMAYVQMKSVVASIIYSFELHVENHCDKAPPAYDLTLTMKMKDGLLVRVKPRR